MYKAVHTETEEEIIILHPSWRGRIDHLRTMDKANLLVCQGCRQPLRVKAGQQKRPHFAHKHLKACSLGSESPAVLIARAVLYDFLLGYFGQGVTLEKQLPGGTLPRPVDCWVEGPEGSLAYWIIEGGIKIEPREAIKQALSQPGISPNWLFLVDMLNEEKKLFHSVLLTPTERVFLQPTVFDQALAGAAKPGGSLHYLDPANETVITYRNLILHHRPNWFQGLKKASPLRAMFVDRRTGQWIHPGEERRLESYRQHQQRLAEKRAQLDQRAGDWERRLASRRTGDGDGWGIDQARRWKPPKERANETLRCVECGQMTTDYWMTFFDAGEKVCRCRNCLG